MPDRPPPRAPKGTGDVLAPESDRWHHVVETVGRVAGAAGFGRFHGPVVEDVEAVRRAGDPVIPVSGPVGDAAGPALALAGGRASVRRAFTQHELPTPWKAWWNGPALHRGPDHLHQHHEVGLEALGSPDPDLDVEVITVGHDVLAALGVRRSTLVLTSVGTVADRERYAAALRDWLALRVDDLADEDRRRVEADPLAVLASAQPRTRDVAAAAPHPTDALSAEGRAHLERVQEGLGAAGIAYLLDHRLAGRAGGAVHTVFEIQAADLAVDGTPLLAGRRHQGPPPGGGPGDLTGVGWTGTVEGLLAALDAEGAPPPAAPALDAFVVDLVGGSAARDLTVELRRAGLRVDRAYDDRSMRAQMKAADRSGARVALIVGPQEVADGVVAVRPLRGGGEADQRTVARARVVSALGGPPAP